MPNIFRRMSSTRESRKAAIWNIQSNRENRLEKLLLSIQSETRSERFKPRPSANSPIAAVDRVFINVDIFVRFNKNATAKTIIDMTEKAFVCVPSVSAPSRTASKSSRQYPGMERINPGIALIKRFIAFIISSLSVLCLYVKYQIEQNAEAYVYDKYNDICSRPIFN